MFIRIKNYKFVIHKEFLGLESLLADRIKKLFEAVHLITVSRSVVLMEIIRMINLTQYHDLNTNVIFLPSSSADYEIIKSKFLELISDSTIPLDKKETITIKKGSEAITVLTNRRIIGIIEM